MKLTTFLAQEHIYLNVEASSKKKALELVGKLIAENINRNIDLDNQWQDNSAEPTHHICAVECFGNLFKREKLGSTALNYGIALPHAKLPENSPIQLDTPIAIFLKLTSPIDYEASDHKEVDLIFAMMFPHNNCENFKSYLPAVANKLSDKAFVKQLRNMDTISELWQLLDSETLDIE